MPSTSNRLRTINLHIRIGFYSMRFVSVTRRKLLVSPRLVNFSDQLSPPWKDYMNCRGVDDKINCTTSSNSDAFLFLATTRKPNCKSTASLSTIEQRKHLMFQSVYIPVCFVTRILDITATEVRVSLTECKVTTLKFY